MALDQRRQHGDAEDEPDRDRERHHHRLPDGGGRRAQHGHEPDDLRPPGHLGRRLDRRRGWLQRRLEQQPEGPPCGGHGLPGSAQSRLDEPRRPGREPDREQGRRLGRRQDRHLRRARRRQADKRHDPRQHGHHRCDSSPRHGTVEADGELHDRRDLPAADRHPGEGERHLHLRPQHPRSRDDPRPGCPSAWTGWRDLDELRATDRECDLDQPHSGREGRPARQLPRRRCAEGVRRDPGGRPAPGHLEERPEARRLRQLLEGQPCGRGRPPGPVLDGHRQRSRRSSLRRRTR